MACSGAPRYSFETEVASGIVAWAGRHSAVEDDVSIYLLGQLAH